MSNDIDQQWAAWLKGRKPTEAELVAMDACLAVGWGPPSWAKLEGYAIRLKGTQDCIGNDGRVCDGARARIFKKPHHARRSLKVGVGYDCGAPGMPETIHGRPTYLTASYDEKLEMHQEWHDLFRAWKADAFEIVNLTTGEVVDG